MISAQPNKPQQEKLIAKLMELPNNAVRQAFLKPFFCIYKVTDQSVGFSDGASSPEHGRAREYGKYQDPVQCS